MGPTALDPKGLINVDGDVVVHADGQIFAGNVAPDQFVEEVKTRPGAEPPTYGACLSGRRSDYGLCRPLFPEPSNIISVLCLCWLTVSPTNVRGALFVVRLAQARDCPTPPVASPHLTIVP